MHAAEQNPSQQPSSSEPSNSPPLLIQEEPSTPSKMHQPARRPASTRITQFIASSSPIKLFVIFFILAFGFGAVVWFTVGPPSSVISTHQKNINKKIRGIDGEFDQHEQDEREGKSCCKGHMVMVPGHGVYRGADYNTPYSESAWALEKFQLGRHHPESMVDHISKAIEIVAADPTATLIFSGGQTRPDCVARSEGATYLDLVVHNVDKVEGFAPAKAFIANMTRVVKKGSSSDNGQNSAPELAPRRMLAEEFARDSYENLLFSVCRYFEYFGSFPATITVVGFPHKRERFESYHRVAMKWPGSRFRYVGIKAPMALPESDGASLVRAGRDPYLCKENRVTRIVRNPNRLVAPYLLTVPASVRKLLRYCGPKMFQGFLPWNSGL